MRWLARRFFQWHDRKRAERVVRILRPHVRGATLDVGCWNGEVARELGAEEIVGIDVVDPPAPTIPVHRFDGEHIPFGDRSFDTVISGFVLHHAKKPEALLGEMLRVGRRVLVLEDNVDTLRDRATVVAVHEATARCVGMPYQHNGFRTLAGWNQLFASQAVATVACTRHPGVMPGWPMLRHYLFVLEAA